ncbi:MAG: histone [Parachlamydiaceae bacterium]|nr:histone [Parachlamydiaceae bacterium]
MALQNTITHLKDMISRIAQDLMKAEGGNKAAAQRVRTTTVRFEKLAKAYRKESIQSEKQTKGSRRSTTKKSATKSKTTTTTTKAKATTAKLKAKPKAKAALARPRALAFKKPTAKSPARRSR